eukprot:TRINITY_DN130_c1_g1_i1.p1 TRINITY_DN130_c1_g1~~TRINITY_DN130_c1_g1_i1.p1  ORF type:complete len:177 (-),score=10.31 TRINITY_DN130_c1_g1_i1:1503-2033(-)
MGSQESEDSVVTASHEILSEVKAELVEVKNALLKINRSNEVRSLQWAMQNVDSVPELLVKCYDERGNEVTMSSSSVFRVILASFIADKGRFVNGYYMKPKSTIARVAGITLSPLLSGDLDHDVKSAKPDARARYETGLKESAAYFRAALSRQILNLTGLDTKWDESNDAFAISLVQ